VLAPAIGRPEWLVIGHETACGDPIFASGEKPHPVLSQCRRPIPFADLTYAVAEGQKVAYRTLSTGRPSGKAGPGCSTKAARRVPTVRPNAPASRANGSWRALNALCTSGASSDRSPPVCEMLGGLIPEIAIQRRSKISDRAG
jgi:hypothetical protein